MVQIFSGAAYIDKVEEKAAVKRNAWVELTNSANMLVAREQNPEAKAALKKVAEALRYADPVSVTASESIEMRIEALLLSARGDNCQTTCNHQFLFLSFCF